jgi:25S rRNA (adenine2142-N1)-methyltransferase
MVKRKKPVPLAPPPAIMKSRKKARVVTSLFHKLTRQLDQAKAEAAIANANSANANDNVNAEQHNANERKIASIEQEIKNMGGRDEYQRASQLSTKFHSTSKWVLGELGKRKWLHGIELGVQHDNHNDDDDMDADTQQEQQEEKMTRKKDGTKNKKRSKSKSKRAVKILEVGAINAELIDAGSKTKQVLLSSAAAAENPNPLILNDAASEVDATGTSTTDNDKPMLYKTIPLYNLNVRAIDLKSSHAQIEEQDFLTLPVDGTFDVIVCSMVLNCVTNAADRGKMLSLLYRQLAMNGLCFLTIPRLCLSQSKYLNKNIFESMLRGVGFDLESKRESPKVAFWVLKKRVSISQNDKKKQIASSNRWKRLTVMNKGKKFRNEFGVVLNDTDLLGLEEP